MENFSKKTPLERLTQLVAVTPHEVALSLAGLNPAFRISEVPDEIRPFVHSVRQAIARALKNHLKKHVATDEAIDASLVFASAYLFIEPTTPDIITTKIGESVDWLSRFNNWRVSLYELGGLALLDDVAARKKSGRGQHRKDDEQHNTDKLIALLVMLLVQKTGAKYGDIKNPVKSEIYNDIDKLAKSEGISLKGIGKSTFYKKIEQSFYSI